MTNMLTKKLELFGPLGDDDKRFLDEVVTLPRSVMSHRDIIEEGDPTRNVHLVLQGLCYRYKYVDDGSRQILGYLLPGDFCDLNVFILEAMDHGIAALITSQIVDIPRPIVLKMTERPNIARALWWATLVDEATLREWLVNVGRRDAGRRIAHFICEIHLRMRSVGLANDNEFEFPVTQAELGDTLSLSTVHVNRTLGNLRSRGLLIVRQRIIQIPDIGKLREYSEFNSNYLHLNGGKRDQIYRPMLSSN